MFYKYFENYGFSFQLCGITCFNSCILLHVNVFHNTSLCVLFIIHKYYNYVNMYYYM